MSTTDTTEQADTEVTTEELLERQRGLEARIEKVEGEVETLRADFEKLDTSTVTESVINILINELASDGADVDFDRDPAFNRAAVRSVDERLADLETTVELLQHDSAEVAE